MRKRGKVPASPLVPPVRQGETSAGAESSPMSGVEYASPSSASIHGLGVATTATSTLKGEMEIIGLVNNLESQGEQNSSRTGLNVQEQKSTGVIAHCTAACALSTPASLCLPLSVPAVPMSRSGKKRPPKAHSELPRRNPRLNPDRWQASRRDRPDRWRFMVLALEVIEANQAAPASVGDLQPSLA